MELANGRYLARGVLAALGLTSKNSEQVAVQFRLLAEDLAGRHITWYGYFTEATIERTIESLRACGWEGNDLDDLTGIDRNDVELVVENEEYNGVTSPRVRWVNRVGGLALNAPMQPDQARAFAARMKGAVLAAGKKTGAPAPKAANGKPGGPPSPEPPPIVDDPKAPPF